MTDTGPTTPLPLLAKMIVPLHTFIYRVSGGRLGKTMGGAPVLLLMVRGRKSGKLYRLPLIYVTTDKGYAVIATQGGAPKHPAWFLNLQAAGAAVIQIGSDKIPVKAHVLPDPTDPRHQMIWQAGVDIFPGYNEYKARTSRLIPIVELLP
jgi:deazaflavin-dependent oxidoreductase (nitroreductase family)